MNLGITVSVWFCGRIIPTGKLRVSECVTQCQKQTTQSMFFVICSTDSHRYPKNKPSHSSFSAAFGTGGKSRVITFNTQCVHVLYQFKLFKLLFQCVVPENTHTSLMGRIYSLTPLPPTPLEISLNFLDFTDRPQPQEIPIPCVVDYGCFLELHIRTFLHLEKQCSQAGISVDALELLFIGTEME